MQATASLREGLWEKSKFEGIELAGKVLGIVGMGRIGNAVAQRAAALGMLVLGYDNRTVGTAPYMHMVELDELLAKSDFITLHIPLTESSHHMINAEFIAKMKKGVRIVDCARGGVIDEDALYDAIMSGQVAGGRAGRLRERAADRSQALRAAAGDRLAAHRRRHQGSHRPHRRRGGGPADRRSSQKNRMPS